jgi:hypothetical protein
MFFIATGGLGLVLMVVVFIIFATASSETSAKILPPLMWGFLGLDILTGSFLFAVIQGAFLWWYYHNRKAAGPPLAGPAPGSTPGSGEPPTGPAPGSTFGPGKPPVRTFTVGGAADQPWRRHPPTTATSPPAGWYPDPVTPTLAWRWWNGSARTADIRGAGQQSEGELSIPGGSPPGS